MTPQLSERIQRVAPSATVALTRQARELIRAGRDIVVLSAGEPDFGTPAHIQDAGVAAMRAGHTGYTDVDGTPELKRAVAAHLGRMHGIGYRPEEVNISPGGKAVIANAFAATLCEGDEVVVPAPFWVSYPEMAKLYGATPVVVRTDADFQLHPDALEAAITPRTRWVVLNSPNNPTGAVMSEAKLESLGEVLLRHPGVMVLSDDIYGALTYHGAAHTLAGVVPGLAERTLTMGGVSKAYAMTGWRIGWGAGPEWLVSAMRKVMGQTTGCPCSISQAAAVEALDGPQSLLESWRNTYRAQRDLVVQGLNALPGVSVAPPAGAFYAFARIDAADDAAWCRGALEEAGVALVPGSAFGAPGHFRLSFAASEAELREAVRRLRAWLAQPL